MKTDWKMETDDFVQEVEEDSRERIEADLLAYTKSWHDYDGNYMKLYSTVAYAQVKELLDRQAAITERELCVKCEWPSLAAMPDLEQQKRIAEQDRRIVEYAEQVDSLTAERDGLQAKLDAYDETHMLLPVDADGVPIHVGDEIQFRNDSPITVDSIGTSRVYGSDWGFFGSNGGFYGQGTMKNVHHVKPRTLESILCDALADVSCMGDGIVRTFKPDELYVTELAAEIRELLGGDGA